LAPSLEQARAALARSTVATLVPQSNERNCTWTWVVGKVEGEVVLEDAYAQVTLGMEHEHTRDALDEKGARTLLNERYLCTDELGGWGLVSESQGVAAFGARTVQGGRTLRGHRAPRAKVVKQPEVEAGCLLWLHYPLLMALREARDGLDFTHLPRPTHREAVNRTRASVQQARKVGALLRAPASEEEQADEEEETPEARDNAESAGFPRGSFHTWSRMRPLLRNQAGWSEGVKRRVRLGDPDNEDEDHHTFGLPYLQAVALLLRERAAPRDELYGVARSGMLIQPQLSALYSALGTKVHLRLAVGALSSWGRPARNRAYVPLDLYDRRRLVFPPAELDATDLYRQGGMQMARGACASCARALAALAQLAHAASAHPLKPRPLMNT
jgi:hypothetical protein